MHSSKTYRHYLTRDLTAKYRTILDLNKEITQLKGGKRFEDTSQKKICKMDNKHVKRCSKSVVIREMQIEPMRYHYTLTGMSKIKKKGNIKYCKDMEELEHSFIASGSLN